MDHSSIEDYTVLRGHAMGINYHQTPFNNIPFNYYEILYSEKNLKIINWCSIKERGGFFLAKFRPRTHLSFVWTIH
jgi:hypothetical protein